MYNKKLCFLLCIILTILLCACGSKNVVVDYQSEVDFENDLNTGKNLEGKTVIFEAREIHPDSAVGFNIYTGEHLNFISKGNPNIDVGDKVLVKVNTIESLFGSYIISYDILEIYNN